jgi:hypothetical protein
VRRVVSVVVRRSAALRLTATCLSHPRSNGMPLFRPGVSGGRIAAGLPTDVVRIGVLPIEIVNETLNYPFLRR